MLGTLVDAPIDAIEQELIHAETLVARLRLFQVERIRKLQDAQVHTADGALSMAEWLRGRLDVSADTARDLLRTTARLADDGPLEQAIEGREVSFDRIVATVDLIASGADQRTIDDSFGRDIAGVRRIAARHRRTTPADDQRGYESQFLSVQPTLDNTGGRIRGELWGLDFATVDEALSRRADELRTATDPKTGRRQRMAQALVAMSHDSLDGTPSPQPSGRAEPAVAIIVDGDLAAATQGESGAEIAYGPKIGPISLQRLLCGSPISLIETSNGIPVRTSRRSRRIPPAIRRFVALRDGGCVIDGCSNTYRIEPHHMRPWAQDGDHDPRYLASVCWPHHHIAIHQRGYRIDPDSPPQRRRLLPPRPT